MKNRSSRGRPPVHQEPRHVTSIALDVSQVEFLKENNINLSDLVRNSIEAMQNKDLFKIHELEQKILKMKLDLKVLEDQYKRMLIENEEKEEIRRSQKVAEEYQAYWLRQLILNKKYDIRKQFDYIPVLHSDSDINSVFDIQGRNLFLKQGISSQSISQKCRLVLRNVAAVQRGDHFEIPEPKKILYGKIKEDLKIEKEDLLIAEIEEGFLTEDLLPAYFLKFGPKITDPALAKKVREEYSEFLRKSHIQMIPEGPQESD